MGGWEGDRIGFKKKQSKIIYKQTNDIRRVRTFMPIKYSLLCPPTGRLEVPQRACRKRKSSSSSSSILTRVTRLLDLGSDMGYIYT